MIARLDKENAVLLNLLGEKEEELENMVIDLKDVKNLYKSQLESLYDQITPGFSSESGRIEDNTNTPNGVQSDLKTKSGGVS